MEPINIVPVDEKTIICAYYDEFATDPLRWHDIVSVHAIKSNYRYSGPSAGDDTHGDAITAIYNNNDNYEPELKKHFDRAGTVYRVVEVCIDREWAGTFVFYIEPGKIDQVGNGQAYLDAAVKEYMQYAAGEVYLVTLEKLETWTNSRGDKREEWERAESIGDVYEDVSDPDTLMKIARTYFGGRA